MKTPFGQLTYCSNIHAGESWDNHFETLRTFVPRIKARVSGRQPFGIGLRLSNKASLELEKEERLQEFLTWLYRNDCYVFTMNGFPYGGFHGTVVKDQVHAPDWLHRSRVDYTKRLFDILTRLLPNGMEGGVSTSPLTYRYWHMGDGLNRVFETATEHIVEIAIFLYTTRLETGHLLHLDIEPEPDGLLETSQEFMAWYRKWLIPIGKKMIADQAGVSATEAERILRDHIRLCYDICHFAISYEVHAKVLEELEREGIKVGKVQISAALKAMLQKNRKEVTKAFGRMDEPTYLHQVIARKGDGCLVRYKDIPNALSDAGNNEVEEWRAHFHVPLFVKEYGLLQSTQEDIVKILKIQKGTPFTRHLEVETYTWEVLPESLKLPIDESIVREIKLGT